MQVARAFQTNENINKGIELARHVTGYSFKNSSDYPKLDISATKYRYTYLNPFEQVGVLVFGLQGRSQDFSKGGHTVPKRGYAQDFHVAFATCCRLFA